MAERPARPAVFSIPANKSFADALVSGVTRLHGTDPLVLARGRILLPNNRAVRSVRDAFVRASGNGLVLPRLVVVGDPELGDRIGGALDPLDLAETLPPAIAPLERQIRLAGRLQLSNGLGAAEAMRLAADLARALDALEVEEVDPARLSEAAAEAGPELAAHWQQGMAAFERLAKDWPAELERDGLIDLTRRRNRQLRALARRWHSASPDGFTIAAGITTSAPAVAALLKAIAFLPEGMVVLPGLALGRAMSDEEWEALGPDDRGRREDAHPQAHLKLLLDRIGVARAEVQTWPGAGRAASSAARALAVANAMSAPAFTDKWADLPATERRLTGVKGIELPDPASEAQAIALALREALETPGQTAALVTPDRGLAQRVSAHLARWGIDADDSAGQPLSATAPGSLLLAIVEAVEESWAPVPLLALLKHPLVGAPSEERRDWLNDVRALDLALRGPRPPAGLAGLDQRLGDNPSWVRLRPMVADVAGSIASLQTLGEIVAGLRAAIERCAGDRAWRGPAGEVAANLVADIEASSSAADFPLRPGDALPLLRDLADSQIVRRPFGGHPRVSIWGLLEARLQHADLMVLGGLNEGVWPPQATADPWLAPAVRRAIGLPGPETRAGLAAHDFALALGAPRVLVTRARRDARSPTVASRLWLRLEAMTGGLTRDRRLERWVDAIDRPDRAIQIGRPNPRPPVEHRPKRILVTDLDRLKADPFAFYAKTMLRLRSLDPVDADQTAAWKGSAVHDVLDSWFKQDDCDPSTLAERARRLIEGDDIHPMLRALWGPRLEEAISWVATAVAADRIEGRLPVAAEIDGIAEVAGIELKGRADRIDRLADGRLAIVDYKTGKPPSDTAVVAGFALQLGLLGLIAARGGFKDIFGASGLHEYWSLAKGKGSFGYRQVADRKMGAEAFLVHAEAVFRDAVETWLTGDAPFTAKLHPAYAPYGDYDQLMRLEEWYGKEPGSAA